MSILLRRRRRSPLSSSSSQFGAVAVVLEQNSVGVGFLTPTGVLLVLEGELALLDVGELYFWSR